jgi:hypothetical protein
VSLRVYKPKSFSTGNEKMTTHALSRENRLTTPGYSLGNSGGRSSESYIFQKLNHVLPNRITYFTYEIIDGRFVEIQAQP